MCCIFLTAYAQKRASLDFYSFVPCSWPNRVCAMHVHQLFMGPYVIGFIARLVARTWLAQQANNTKRSEKYWLITQPNRLFLCLNYVESEGYFIWGCVKCDNKGLFTLCGDDNGVVWRTGDAFSFGFDSELSGWDKCTLVIVLPDSE